MSRISTVEVGRVDYPLVAEFKFSAGGVRPSEVVRLVDDDGVEGWGQAVPTPNRIRAIFKSKGVLAMD